MSSLAPRSTASSSVHSVAIAAPTSSSSTIFAVLAMDPAQANLAFQVISERYEYHRSTCITTNRLFKDWPKVFPDALDAQVIAERFTERSERFILDGKGYRPTKNAT